MKRQPQTIRYRHGFTLLELLVVVGIIGFLAALSVTVMIGIADQASEEATVTTLQKVNRLVEQRQEAFDRAFPSVQALWSANFRDYVAQVVSVQQGIPLARVRNLLARYSADSEVWNILGRKAAFRFEFPQRMAPDLMPGGPGGLNDTNNNGIPDNLETKLARPIAHRQLVEEGVIAITAPLTDPAVLTRVSDNWMKHTAHEVQAIANENIHSTESSELLYFLLLHSGNYGASAAGEDDFRSSEIADTDGDGYPEFVDAWGHPLRFYRWPTRLIDPNLSVTAFRPPPTGGPLDMPILTSDDHTDLEMTISIDGVVQPPVGGGIGRSVNESERGIADFLIRGLPRRISFTSGYLNALANNLDDPSRTGDVNVLIPPDALLRDPDDPAGLLYAILENGLSVGAGTISLAAEFNEAAYHTPDTFHAPLIVSAGSDESLGLLEPSDTANLGHLAMYNLDLDGNGTPGEVTDFELMIEQVSDNLTNRNRRAGGRK